VVICLERGADLHMAQLMPLPLTVSCFSKSKLVPAHLGSPGKRAVKQVCVCVCSRFTSESVSERIVKIGWHLGKLWLRVWCLVVLTQGVVIHIYANDRPSPSSVGTVKYSFFGIAFLARISDRSRLSSNTMSTTFRRTPSTSRHCIQADYLFRECCSRRRFQPYDCVIFRFVE